MSGEKRRLLIRRDGIVEALWSDKLPFTLLGRVQTLRMSNVEWDEALQQWVARSTIDGRILAVSPNRSECICLEVAALQVRL